MRDLTYLLEQLEHHLGEGKLGTCGRGISSAGFPKEMEQIKLLEKRGKYLDETTNQIENALTEIRTIAEKENYTDILNILNKNYDDKWDEIYFDKKK